MSKNQSSPVLDLSTGLAAGILIPLGQPPWGFWGLSIAGLALLFIRNEENTRWFGVLTALGFALGYVVSGQLWVYNSQYLLTSLPLTIKLYGAGAIFGLPALIITMVISLYPSFRKLLNIPPYSLSSCILFSCFWILFELLYSLVSISLPLLISGYSILGFPSDSVIPIFGILGASFLLTLIASTLTSTVIHLKSLNFRPLFWLTPSLALLLVTPLLLSKIHWTWPYDQRPFHYAMQVHTNADAPDNFYPELISHNPRLIILGGIEGNADRPHFFNLLPKLEKNDQTAFLAVFSQGKNCPGKLL